MESRIQEHPILGTYEKGRPVKFTYDGKEVSSSSRITVRTGAYVYLVSLIILFWLLLLSKDMISTFIYFQF